MAAITLDTAHRAAGQFEAVLAGLHEMLDAFVSYRMRLAAAQAEYVRPRSIRNTSSSLISGR